MLSVSQSTDMAPSSQLRFRAVAPKDSADIVKVMLTHCWSPIVWQGGYRRRSAFRSADYIALDFDDGTFTIKDAIKFLTESGTEGYIGTTKSHQLEKMTATGMVRPAADRFRLLMPAAHTIKDRAMYEENMRRIMKVFPSDKSCTDAARFFFPCTDLVYLQAGNAFPVDVSEELKAEVIKETERIEKTYNREADAAKMGMLPGWIIAAITGDTPEGGRHKMCYRMGATLGRAGWTIPEITNLIWKTSLKKIGNVDVLRAVENGWHAGRRKKQKEASKST